ncbi:MAG: DUF4230 domain-containing protein [Phenylobacterium sp.]|uniref:DUF4230 domain-containing protein n=1 Tax=Phenylobacterium sp. TaxID=1871053 RepID=UPI0027176E8B|nr:DUF4230 domain-containing protein [Phenylobacterium sp.]MDO8911524.1 DUF4230 domain-containing protein [Phenylobacterium sp.]MDP3100273.1 DUF4230 domain-containing protein [Phenylobacterium sp.]
MAGKTMTWIAGAGVVAALVTGGFYAGHGAAQRESSDTQVRSLGVFSQQTERVLAATVTNLQAENRLVVYQYTGDVRVAAEKSDLGGLLKTSQELTVPATVSYFVDMSRLRPEHLTFDKETQTVHVKLPPLMIGDPAFQPERARAANGGLLTLNADVVQDLNRVNYRSARRAFVRQAQQRQFVDLARDQARKNVEAYFEIPLRVVGSPNIKVTSSF